jgi:hypothetical protein
MLFDAKQFEQFFKERTLKKGLNLFESGKVDLLERSGSYDYLFLAGEEELSVKKKGDKVLSYSCSCNNMLFCEHLSGAMFYFQQHALGIGLKKKKAANKSLQKSAWNRNYRETFHKLNNVDLIAELKRLENQFAQSDLKELFSKKDQITPFDFYCLRIRTLIKPYLDLVKLNQSQIESLYKKLNLFKNKSEEEYFSKLAFISEFALVVNLRFSGAEQKLFDLYATVKKQLEARFQIGLKKQEKTALFAATEKSIKNNAYLNSEAFIFLMPYFLTSSKNSQDTEQVRLLLEKRKYKRHHPSFPYDKLLLARLEIAISEWKLFKRPFPFKIYEEEPELAPAKSELDFANGKTEKGFGRLISEYEKLQPRSKKLLSDLAEYIVAKAKEKNKKNIEQRFLKEQFIYSLNISEAKLDSFIALLPPKDRQKELDELIQIIKNRGHYSFDKLATLLMKAGHLNELINEIAKQNNKFNLLHQVILMNFPNYDEKHIDLYVKQLMQAFEERKIYSYQEQLFEISKEYINKLPTNLKRKAITNILEKVGGQSKIYKHVRQIFKLPAEENVY